ncbi:MAG: F0F1 ATP synthase subunit B [Bacteroidales bacterium]|nr:F0F1 ATP synthase subunit B [Bacteroidales bacterium]
MDGLLSPEPGLVIWSGLTFLILFLLLRKFAWRPILGAIKEREDKIESALASAEEAKAEYRKVQEAKAQMAAEARQERDSLLKEARLTKEAIIEEARKTAKEEADKILADAKAQINKEKADAIVDLKQQVAKLSVDIAGKILSQTLQTDSQQEKLIEKYLNESNFN